MFPESILYNKQTVVYCIIAFSCLFFLPSRYFLTPYPTPAASKKLNPPSIGQSAPHPGSVCAMAKKGVQLIAKITTAVIHFIFREFILWVLSFNIIALLQMVSVLCYCPDPLSPGNTFLLQYFPGVPAWCLYHPCT